MLAPFTVGLPDEMVGVRACGGAVWGGVGQETPSRGGDRLDRPRVSAVKITVLP